MLELHELVKVVRKLTGGSDWQQKFTVAKEVHWQQKLNGSRSLVASVQWLKTRLMWQKGVKK